MSQVETPAVSPLDDPRRFLSNPDALYEVVDGKVVELPEMGALSHYVSQWLLLAILEHLRESRSGRAFLEAIFILDPDRDLRRRPDVAYVSYDRFSAERKLPRTGDYDVVPELAIEVTSPNDTLRSVNRKIREYFHYGVREVWLVDPLERQVAVYNSPTQVRILDGTATLDGGEVLPGFKVRLEDLFQAAVD